MRQNERSAREYNARVRPVVALELQAHIDWFAERLSDLALLGEAVVVRVDGEEWTVAVPVGGTRRAGFVPVATRRQAKRIFKQLLPYSRQFPNLRIWYSTSPDVCHNVRWGEAEPEIPDVEASDEVWMTHDRSLGNLYGYSAQAIDRFIAEQY